MRNRFGFGVDFCHDVHEHLDPINAIHLAKGAGAVPSVLLRDSLAPEQIEWFKMMRGQTSTPIAMGELFNNPREITPLVAKSSSTSFAATSARSVASRPPRSWPASARPSRSARPGTAREIPLLSVTRRTSIWTSRPQTSAFRNGPASSRLLWTFPRLPRAAQGLCLPQ